MLENYAEVEPKIKFLAMIESLIKRGGDLAVAADFDQNISRSSGVGLDPRDTYVDPQIKQAFLDIRSSGRDVVIISSRGARDVAKMIDVPGVSVIGSLGWETLDAEGVSHIHPRFLPYQQQITAILAEVRERFFIDQLHISTAMEDEPNCELLTPEGGKIILQRKGCNDQYPEGINSTWALNLVNDNAREHYQQALINYYEEAFERYATSSQSDRAALQKMCGLLVSTGKTVQGVPTLDIEIRPTSQGTKAKAMIQLMRKSDDQKRHQHFTDMPAHDNWIYSGDHAEQDSPPMRAGHTANFLTQGKHNVFGIWSKPPYEEDKFIRGVDVAVEGVSGNAKLMKDVAALMTRNPV